MGPRWIPGRLRPCQWNLCRMKAMPGFALLPLITLLRRFPKNRLLPFEIQKDNITGRNDVATMGESLDTRASLLVAAAKMVAHIVATAVEARIPAERINSVPHDISATPSLSEIWVTGADGNVEFTTKPDLDFKFPTDQVSGTQAASSARLLEGTASEGTPTAVLREPQPREYDGAVFRYVGVPGIVQVGSAGEPWQRRPELAASRGPLHPCRR